MTRFEQMQKDARAAERLKAWLAHLRDAGLTDLAAELSRVLNVYGNPSRKVSDMRAYAAALHKEGSHGLAKEIEKVLAEPVMSTEQMKALAAEGTSYAGEDQYPGALLIRDLAAALTEAADRLKAAEA